MQLHRAELGGQQARPGVEADSSVRADLGQAGVPRQAELDRGGDHQLAQLGEVVTGVQDYQHPAAGPGDPAQLAHRGRPVRHVIEHVRRQRDVGHTVSHREARRVPGEQASRTRGPARRQQHPG